MPKLNEKRLCVNSLQTAIFGAFTVFVRRTTGGCFQKCVSVRRGGGESATVSGPMSLLGGGGEEERRGTPVLALTGAERVPQLGPRQGYPPTGTGQRYPLPDSTPREYASCGHAGGLFFEKCLGFFGYNFLFLFFLNWSQIISTQLA